MKPNFSKVAASIDTSASHKLINKTSEKMISMRQWDAMGRGSAYG